MPAKEQNKGTSTLKTLLEWQALARPFKVRSREYFSTILAIAFLLIVIAFFLKEWFLIMVIVALVFVHYVMSTVKPEKISHQITNRGVVTGEKTYLWSELSRFWFTGSGDEAILHLQKNDRFPKVLLLLLGETDKKQVQAILADHLTLEEPEATWIDKATVWLSEKISLEKTS